MGLLFILLVQMVFVRSASAETSYPENRPISIVLKIPEAQDALAKELMAIGYEQLFWQGGDKALNAIWSRAGTPQLVFAVATNPDIGWQPRFLASEILFRKKWPGFPPATIINDLAMIYMEALRANPAGNDWALPGEYTGIVGRHLIGFGKIAITPLAPLLRDDRVVQYVGSEDATVGNALHCRIKDLAAFFIGAIQNQPYVMPKDLKARDKAIDQRFSTLLKK